MKKKKIFFYIKSHFRERQWDTVRNVPEDFIAVYPPEEKPLWSVNINKPQKTNLLKKLKHKILDFIPLINIKKVPAIANECDFIYTWGYLPLGAKKPFIIEMDNPYSLTYYNIHAFQKYREILKIFLERAHKLTFMSEASMHHFLQEWGGRYKNKSMVFYPYARRRYKRHKEIEKKEVLNFLFVGLDFRRKGGFGVIRSFC